MSAIILPISVGTDAFWNLDDTQALILILAFVKLVLIGSIANVFPIDGDALFSNIKFVLGRKRRNIPSINEIDYNLLHQVPDVTLYPCSRRFLCDLEKVAKGSKNYLPVQDPTIEYDSIVVKEELPDESKTMGKKHVEPQKSLFRDRDPTGEINLHSNHAIDLVNSPMGEKFCKEAYKQCPRWFSASMVFKAIFDEFIEKDQKEQ